MLMLLHNLPKLSTHFLPNINSRGPTAGHLHVCAGFGTEAQEHLPAAEVQLCPEAATATQHNCHPLLPTYTPKTAATWPSTTRRNQHPPQQRHISTCSSTATFSTSSNACRGIQQIPLTSIAALRQQHWFHARGPQASLNNISHNLPHPAAST